MGLMGLGLMGLGFGGARRPPAYGLAVARRPASRRKSAASGQAEARWTRLRAAFSTTRGADLEQTDAQGGELGLATGAIDVRVEMPGLAHERGDDVAGIEASRGGFQTGDDTTFAFPRSGGVVEGGKCPHLHGLRLRRGAPRPPRAFCPAAGRPPPACRSPRGRHGWEGSSGCHGER